MKKKEDILFLLFGMIVFYISTFLDKTVGLMFQNVNVPFIDFTLSIVTNFGFVLAVILLIPAIILYNQDKRLLRLLILTFCAAFVFSFVLKLIVLRQRPTDALYYPLVNIINYSFPSMHSMVVFSLLPLLTAYLVKYKPFWTSFAFIVAFSRIYFAFHYLSDVVFGAVVGYLMGKILLEFHQEKKWNL